MPGHCRERAFIIFYQKFSNKLLSPVGPRQRTLARAQPPARGQEVVCGRHQGIVERYLVYSESALRIAAVMDGQYQRTNSFHTPRGTSLALLLP